MDSGEALAWSAPLLGVGVGLSAFTSGKFCLGGTLDQLSRLIPAQGAIASLSLITVPAILNNTTNASILNGWRHTFQYGVKVAPPFAVAATIAHIFNAYINRNSTSVRARYSAIAAVSTIAIVPFTMIFMASANSELFNREQAARGTAAGIEPSSVELVKKWGRLNLTRSLLPAAGALFACFAL